MTFSQVFDFYGVNASGKRLVVGIPTSGCRWWRRAEGCIHCSVASVVGLHKPVDSPAALVRNELIRWRETPLLEICLYTPGSILDEEEIDSTELANIIDVVREEASPRKLVIEARPELVRQESLAELRKRSGEMSIEVSIPLESADVEVRRLIGKCFSNDVFITAANIVKESGCAFSTTVLVKPPGLSEGEAIWDAWKSFSWLSALEPCRVVLEPMVVYDKTLLATQYRNGRYRPPWLWSLLALMEAAEGMVIEAGGEFVYPSPIARPKNCAICTPAVEEFLRRKGSVIKDAKRPRCRCENEWMEEVQAYVSMLPTSSAVCASRGRRRWVGSSVRG